MSVEKTLILAVFLIAAMTSGAAEPQRLTADGRLKRDPVYINDGRAVVYSVEHDSPRLILCRLQLAGGSIERVHPKATLPEFRPVFSADEQTFAFLQMTGNDNLTLKVELIAKNREIAIPASKKVVWHTSLSPDGRQVFYSASGQIVSRPVEGGKEKQLTQSVGRNNWPTVSPDGRRVAFGSSRDGDFEIYTMNLDGSDECRLTGSKGLDMRPAWSPDGKRIAFVSGRDGNYEVYVMNADGSNVRRQTTNRERDDYPAWHPNGRQLVYVSERNGGFDLYQTQVASPAAE